ncbi:Transmembrane protein [Entamoeba marina]
MENVINFKIQNKIGIPLQNDFELHSTQIKSLLRLNYEIYQEFPLVSSSPLNPFVNYHSRSELFTICDIIILLTPTPEDIQLLRPTQHLFTSSSTQYPQNSSTIHPIIPTLENTLSNQSIQELAYAKSAALTAISFFGIPHSNPDFGPVVQLHGNSPILQTTAKILSSFNIRLSSAALTPDLILTCSDLSNSFPQSTSVLPVIKDLVIDETYYKILSPPDDVVIHHAISLEFSTAVIHQLRNYKLKGSFEETQTETTIVTNEECVTSGKPSLIKSITNRFQLKWSAATSILLIAIVFVLLIIVWSSAEREVSESVENPLLVMILSCVVGGFLARRISSIIQVSVTMLLTVIGCSVAYSCLNVITDSSNTNITTYKEYGMIVVNLTALFILSISFVSAAVLVYRIIRIY